MPEWLEYGLVIFVGAMAIWLVVKYKAVPAERLDLIQYGAAAVVILIVLVLRYFSGSIP